MEKEEKQQDSEEFFHRMVMISTYIFRCSKVEILVEVTKRCNKAAFKT